MATPALLPPGQPQTVPISTIVTFYQVLLDTNQVNAYLAADGSKLVWGTPAKAPAARANPVKVSDVVALLQTLSAANQLGDFLQLSGDKLVEVDSQDINDNKNFLFVNNIHTISMVANTMVNLTTPGCKGHECPHIPH